MLNFKIIPVVDILNSKVVHAHKGERDKYKPLKTYLTDSTDPLDIINIIKKKFNLTTFYIADLDAILKKKPNYAILNEISKLKEIEIMIDPGITIYEDTLDFLKFNIRHMIIGLETLNSIETLKTIVNKLRNQSVILSIDMYKQKLLTRINSFQNQNPLRIINVLQKLEVNKILLLDLYRVGQKIGGISSLYLNIKKNFDGDVYVGGGIKNYKDIEQYYRNYFAGVLIGTALYDGSIEPQKLSEIINL
jgi:phosphoribosylformimino-5-aminoimidazole carboxamide ribotide isomerase